MHLQLGYNTICIVIIAFNARSALQIGSCF